MQPSVAPTREDISCMPVRGQGLIEYALIIAIVAVMAIAALLLYGPAVASMLSTIGGSV